jgi:hypothetical protein
MMTLQTSTAASAEATDAAATMRPDGVPGSRPSFAQINS